VRTSTDAVRDHLVRALAWEDAHVGLDTALKGIPAGRRGARAAGFDHSCWQLLQHIRLAQDDILDFCVSGTYTHAMTWPDDYWPGKPAPPSPKAWSASITACTRARKRLQQLARDVPDLTAPVPTGDRTQTYLRALLLVIDHTAYHVGQIVAVRRALGIW
jgi:uncharacterized damage-inducible protein DinB